MEHAKTCPCHLPYPEVLDVPSVGDHRCTDTEGVHPTVDLVPGHVNSGKDGWILALTLLLLAVILGLSLASASLILHHMKSSTAFHGIMKKQLMYPSEGGATAACTMMGAPEGWDHIGFCAEVCGNGSGDVTAYSLRLAVREQPPMILSDARLEGHRAHLLFVIDDSEAMLASSGRDYAEGSLYLRKPTGEVVHVSDVPEVAESAVGPLGVYFSGKWGNAFQRAPTRGPLSGAMSVWTYAFSSAKALVDSLEFCEVAVMSTSRGMIEPFTHDWHSMTKALESIHPGHHDAPLSEALHRACGSFPSECCTQRHILLVSAGSAVNDGHLPPWLRDYDHDGNPQDMACEGEGSHCLDDVCAYARSVGIIVHVMGPPTDLLSRALARGGGRSMPQREVFVPDDTVVTQPMVFCAGLEFSPTSRKAHVAPSWMDADSCRYLRRSVMDPLRLMACGGFPLSGIARGQAYAGGSLYCSTTRDQFLKIDLPHGNLDWLMDSAGGDVHVRGGRIIAGPGRDGDVSCIGPGPAMAWQRKGTCMDASDSVVYVGDGSRIMGYDLNAGLFLSSADTGHPVSVVRYDPCEGVLISGTMDGLIQLFKKDLEPAGFVSSGHSDPIREARPFSWRKRLHIVGADGKRLFCCTTDGVVWSTELDEGEPSSMIVMDRKVMVNVWDEAGPCGGIDTGVSRLLVFDAVTGERLSSTILCPGRAYGPSLDVKAGIMKFISSNGGESYEEDISSLPGITPLSLGTRLMQPPE